MPVYTNPIIDQEPSPKVVYYIDNKCALFTCNGSPEGVILANTGSIALSDNGSVFKKTTDDLTTGWVELASGSVSSPLDVSGTNPTINLIDTDVGDDDGVISMQSDVMSIGVSGGTLLQIRSNGHILGYPRTIEVNTTTVGNVGAGLDNLHSFVVPINSLQSNNDYLECEYFGSYAGNDTNKRIVWTVAGGIIEDTGLIDIDGQGWALKAKIVRLSSTTIRIETELIGGVTATDSAGVNTVTTIGGTARIRNFTSTAVADLTANTLTLTVQAEGAANNDIVQDLSIISLCQR